jgi:hypothetical protein
MGSIRFRKMNADPTLASPTLQYGSGLKSFPHDPTVARTCCIHVDLTSNASDLLHSQSYPTAISWTGSRPVTVFPDDGRLVKDERPTEARQARSLSKSNCSD